jgi:hypothetical protein
MEVDESFAGRPARCPTCGHDLRVPKTGEPTPVRGTESPSRPGVTIVKIEGERIEIVPPIETLAVISLGVVGLGLALFLVLGLRVIPTVFPWMIAGFLGSLVVLLGAIMAIPAYHSIRRSRGHKRGLPLALAALAAGGGLFLAFLSIGFVTYALSNLSRPSCEENLRHIYAALRAYADKHQGALPDGHKTTLEALVKEGYLDDENYLTCPAYRVVPGTVTYVLTPYINVNNRLFPADLLIVSDGAPYSAHGDGYVRVLLLDGKVDKIPLSEWPKYQEAQKQRWNKILNEIRQPAKPAASAPAQPEETPDAQASEKAPAAPPPAPRPVAAPGAPRGGGRP